MECFFKKINFQIIQFLDPENQCSEIEKLQMHFAHAMIAYNILTAFIILFISCLIGSLQETALLFCIFGLLRMTAGGFHFDHILKCIAVTTFLIISEGKITQIMQINLPVCLMICLFTNLLFFIHIPKGTENNPYSEAYSQMQKNDCEFFPFY